MRLSFASLTHGGSAVVWPSAVVGVALFGFSAANAQPVTSRHGLTVAVGAGTGSAALSCSSCKPNRISSASGFLRLGYAVDSNLVVNAQGRGWQKSANQETDRFEFLLVGAQYFLRKGFYLEAGLGHGRVLLRDDPSGNQTKSSASAISAGIGYDWRISRTFSVTPFVNGMATSAAKAKVNDMEVNANLSGNVVQLGLALTWQHAAGRRYVPAGERVR